jgi:hypothetical protein
VKDEPWNKNELALLAEPRRVCVWETRISMRYRPVAQKRPASRALNLKKQLKIAKNCTASERSTHRTAQILS